ncbi:malto-oligosyltrehalose trehalohydrolase [Corynebacterium poyangense]|uniref:Malto-oligosyltrehalose trehalohydrolase n=1 Tax=Corynebacterium poyangense TaxID=2684405 RepID=A0A7H0SPR2_9CORY|nr:malto-oligosyltrehalose trehalohydrolase [Corynebacterium poyangense]QNQ90537.1 malto-oligosyltrehalose trehalohydrolase [Corynebacterium poyangense]
MTKNSVIDVWAPRPQLVELVTEDSQGERHIHPMHKSGQWWSSTVPATPGLRYGFRIDGEVVAPDPRATSLPDGPHGLGEIIDPDFSWQDHDWHGRQLPGSVIYELHVGTFSNQGTFDGVINHLDYLVDLGVTTIELMPVQPFGGNRNWGYDGVSWHAVHDGYGGPDGLRRLVNAAHLKGLAVYLDVVYNHFGPDGNYTGLFGPYALPGSMTGWGEVVNISGPDSDEVRRYILDAVKLWFEVYHIDGLRLDAVHAYDDTGAYSIMENIQNVADEVSEKSGIPRQVVAESDLNDPRLINKVEAGGYGLAAQWADDIHHALHTLVSGELHAYYADFGSPSDLKKTLLGAYKFAGDYSSFRGRTHGRPVDTSAVPPWKFITYTTTHDQTGNRARGDRPSMNLIPTQQVLKAAIIYCSPFTPMLFMGEEFGAQTPFPFFCSHTDPELNRLTKEGRYHEFARSGWDESEVPDPADPETFHSAVLDWNFTTTEQEIFNAYRQLLQLRKEYHLDRDTWRSLNVEIGDEDTPWIAFGYSDVALIANLSTQPLTVPVGGNLRYSFSEPTVSSHSTDLGPWEFALVTEPSWG